MKCKLLYTFIVALSGIAMAHAQLCTGSLGDPVVKIDFGSGTATHGPALGSSITSYTYTSANFPNDGSYTIESTTATPNTWWTTTDHTGGGYMMVVNASTSITDYFYKKTVTGLCPDTTYEFAAWIMNLLKSTDNSTPNITFTIEKEDGTILGTYNTGNIPLAGSAVWNQYGFYFDTPAGIDTVVIRMRNNKVGAAPGNDIALDDITFSACGPLVTSTIQNNSSTAIQVCKSSVGSYTFSGAITTSVYSSPSYQWQVSTDSGSTWTDITGATGTTITVQPTTAGVYMYRMATAESTNIASASCRVVSNIITITVLDGPDAPIAQAADTECGNPTGSITISSPTGYTYSIDGTNYQTAAIFSNLAEGDYSVTAKNSTSGCISATTTVHVNVGSGVPDAPQVTVTAPDNCADTTGQLTITDAAAAYSFDNGATWAASAMAALAPGSYNVKVKNAAGCESVATVAVIPDATGFPPIPALSIIQPDCSTATGTITVTDAQSAYSFDNGFTWAANSTKSNVAPGTYQVLTKNNLGCIGDAATAIITGYVNTEPLPVAASPQVFCIYDAATLSSIAVTGTNIQWYNTATGGTALATTTSLQNGVTYYATQTLTTCESNRIAVLINIQDTQAPTGNAAQQFCTTQNPSVLLLNAQGTDIKWYDAAVGGTALAVNTTLTDGTTYYATQTISGCESQNRLAVTVSIIAPSITVQDVAAYVCDEGNDGSEVVNLTDYETAMTADAVTFSYYTSATGAEGEDAAFLIADASAYGLQTGLNTIYVRAASADQCHLIAKLELTLVDVPTIAIADAVPLCQDSHITLDAGYGFDTYVWSAGATTRAITVTEPGPYTITVTQLHGATVCTSVKTVTVFLSNPAVISNVAISDWTVADNTLEVYVSDESIGSYEYSVDGLTWQESNVFTGLETGAYVVYVRDKNGCGLTLKEVYLLNYPKYFTPNGDGQNDAWHVEFAAKEPGLTTRIYDRYGKLITQLKYSEGWDGTYNGHTLPSTDYWFEVVRANGKVYKGHFSMLR